MGDSEFAQRLSAANPPPGGLPQAHQELCPLAGVAPRSSIRRLRPIARIAAPATNGRYAPVNKPKRLQSLNWKRRRYPATRPDDASASPEHYSSLSGSTPRRWPGPRLRAATTASTDLLACATDMGRPCSTPSAPAAAVSTAGRPPSRRRRPGRALCRLGAAGHEAAVEPSGSAPQQDDPLDLRRPEQ
jgi:hypothetical protein